LPYGPNEVGQVENMQNMVKIGPLGLKLEAFRLLEVFGFFARHTQRAGKLKTLYLDQYLMDFQMVE
jgi:hypothetical protein